MEGSQGIDAAQVRAPWGGGSRRNKAALSTTGVGADSKSSSQQFKGP